MHRVLLVEDNDLNRDMLVKRLTRRGYEVLTAVDGREGIDRTKDDRPGIVLMDMSLPEIDGWEATTTLKADPETSQIPVIALTAHAMEGDREKALGAGCDDYETKPIDLERLIEKMEQLLTRQA